MCEPLEAPEWPPSRISARRFETFAAECELVASLATDGRKRNYSYRSRYITALADDIHNVTATKRRCVAATKRRCVAIGAPRFDEMIAAR